MADKPSIYQMARDQLNAPMNMTPQPAIPYSDEHFTANYNTPIPADRQQDYNLWKFQQSLRTGRDVTKDQQDYDVQGFYMKGGATSGNQHGPDTFKKPNHPTFSNQSQYSGFDGYEGGVWGKNGDKWSFTPSDTNKQLWSDQARRRYFQRVEPDSALMENVGGKMMNTNIPGGNNGR